MASDGTDPKKDSKFWLGISDDQDDIRVLFHKKQGERRGIKPPPSSGSTRWPGITITQIGRRNQFFTDQKAALEHNRRQRAPGAGGSPPAKVGSGFWADITVKQHTDRAAFRKRQEDAASKPKSPFRGTDFFADTTDMQRLKRAVFMSLQSDKRSDSTQAVRKAAAKARLKTTAAASTSSQWKTNLVFNFHVAVVGIGVVLGDFRRVSGLGTDDWEYETYREGGDNLAEHILPNHQKNGRVILEWAVRHPDPFQLWFLTMGTGVMTSQPVVITLLEHGAPRAMWTIPQAMIARIEFPELDAMSSEVATNKVELIHNGLIPIPM